MLLFKVWFEECVLKQEIVYLLDRFLLLFFLMQQFEPWDAQPGREAAARQIQLLHRRDGQPRSNRVGGAAEAGQDEHAQAVRQLHPFPPE